VSIHSFVEWLDTFSYVLRPADVTVKEVNHIRCFAIDIAKDLILLSCRLAMEHLCVLHVVAFWRPKSIKDTLVRAAVSRPSSTVGQCKPCGDKHCKCCLQLQHAQVFHSKTTGKEYKIFCDVNCKTPNVVYLLDCNGLHWPTVDEGLDTAALTSVSLILLGRQNATTGGSGNNLVSVSLFSISVQ
jgi:hypothetical protein